MRGKVDCLPQLVQAGRITPAYAGKRSLGSRTNGFNKDHPRLCGEKLTQEIGDGSYPGSPPPMRGKAASHIREMQLPRITPAYAGKRRHVVVVRDVNQDHPRLCGEKHVKYKLVFMQTGSPPPMRGKVIMTATHCTRHRITPAYAGKRNKNQFPQYQK